ncbi:MAG: polysaccharide deacetylase family protein [Gemmatimonadota bacterium]
MVYHALRYAGLTRLARWLRGEGVVLCYHNVVAELNGRAATLGLHIPVAKFERQVCWLAKHYTIVALDEFVDRLRRRGGTSLRRVAAITFDDGYTGVFEYAWPLLSNLGIPATVFLVAEVHGNGREQGFWWDHPEVLRVYSPENEHRWLTGLKGDRAAILGAGGLAPAWCQPATWGTIAGAARAGLGIGAHSATHRALPALADDELHRELVASRDLIRRHTGVDPGLFAYPYGLWDERIRAAVQSAGYRAAFTLAADSRTRTHDPWTVPRLNVPSGLDDAAFQAWTAGLSPPPGWRHA